MVLAKKIRAWSPRLMDESSDSPEVGWLSLGELHYDWLTWGEDGQPSGYQRHPLDEVRIAKYVAEFDPYLLEVITVNRRADGSLWVLDGQHRNEVLRRLGKNVVLAAIYSGLDRKTEADVYHRLNTERKTPNQWNRFGSRGSSGDLKVAALITLASECGFRIGTADRSLQSIAAVNTLDRIYGWPDGPRLLRQVLHKITEVWPADVIARDGVFIEGLALFAWNFDGSFLSRERNTVDWRRFESVFGKIRGTDVTRKAKELKIEAGFAMNASTYATSIREFYNGKSNFGARLEGRIAIPSIRRHTFVTGVGRTR